MNKAEETRKNKAFQLRYKKPIVKDINLWNIREELDDISCECDGVRYYWESDDDTLLNALDGDEDEAYEFKMAFWLQRMKCFGTDVLIAKESSRLSIPA